MTGDPVKAAEEMRAVVKALPEGDGKADDECPICMDAVATGDWQVRACAAMMLQLLGGSCHR